MTVSNKDRKRLVGVAVFLSLLFSVLVLRFYQLQILEGEKWTSLALAQHRTVVSEPGMRGCFFSSTGQPLVLNVSAFHLFADPEMIPAHYRDQIAAELASILNLSEEQRLKILEELGRKSRSRKLCMWLPREVRDRIAHWWGGFARSEKIVRNALFFVSDFKRSYPFGSLLGAVLHTVQDEKNPKTEEHIPTGGLELLLHPMLSGKAGKRKILRSPRNALDTGIVLEEAKHGSDVHLTINHYLQAIAEAELARGVQAAGARGGWAIMMDPYSGEIMALAQVPSFDPSNYRKYFNNPDLKDATRVRAVSDSFEPGSIFKPIMLAICLKANDELRSMGRKPLFSPDEKVSVLNGVVPGRSKPLKDGRAHRFLNMDLAVQKSSNIYIGRMMQRLTDTMGERWIRDALETFGFGKKSGIELPAEIAGKVPTPGKIHPNGTLEWSAPTPYSLGMGHNILVNSIQVIRAYAMIANGGKWVHPHLVRKIVGEGGILLERKNLEGKQFLSENVTKPLMRAMKFTTKEGGTSKRADIMAYSEAGKSGTSEKIVGGAYSTERYFSSFVGFAPANHPRFVLMVVIDEPEKRIIPGVGKMHHGGVCAAPVFREIATRSLRYLGVEPDDPYGFLPGDPRRDSKKADWLCETEALKKLYEEWNKAS